MNNCIPNGDDRALVTITDASSVRVMPVDELYRAIIAGEITFSMDFFMHDDITHLPGAVCIADEFESYTLSPRVAARLLTHSLRPAEWSALVKKYGIRYLLSSEFYHDNGVAINPVHNPPVYEWYDVVEVNGKYYCEIACITGEMDDEDTYQIDDFLEAVAEKHGVDVDDIKTYMMDNIDFDAETLQFGAESCGCYIDGMPEWMNN